MYPPMWFSVHAGSPLNSPSRLFHCSPPDGGTTTFGHESLGSRVSSLCDKLATLAQTVPADTPIERDPRQDIPTETRQYLINWLSSDPRVCERLHEEREGWGLCSGRIGERRRGEGKLYLLVLKL